MELASISQTERFFFFSSNRSHSSAQVGVRAARPAHSMRISLLYDLQVAIFLFTFIVPPSRRRCKRCVTCRITVKVKNEGRRHHGIAASRAIAQSETEMTRLYSDETIILWAPQRGGGGGGSRLARVCWLYRTMSQTNEVLVGAHRRSSLIYEALIFTFFNFVNYFMLYSLWPQGKPII